CHPSFAQTVVWFFVWNDWIDFFVRPLYCRGIENLRQPADRRRNANFYDKSARPAACFFSACRRHPEVLGAAEVPWNFSRRLFGKFWAAAWALLSCLERGGFKEGLEALVEDHYWSFFGSVALVLVFGLWFNYSFYEAFLNAPRLARLLPTILAFFPWLLAEEVFLGAHKTMSRVRRVILTLAFRSIAWGMLAGAVFLLHSGEVLMILLVAYFVLITIWLRLAIDVVRRETQSAPAAALFGAILSAGFALAI